MNYEDLYQTLTPQEKYLREYIRDGGSKIKFVTGRRGCGKTWFLRHLTKLASEENYKTASFSAENIWMNDFKEIYLEIFRQSNILECLEAASHRLIHEMGFDWQEIPTGMRFIDYLSQNGMADAITEREIRAQLKQLFLDNPMLDNNFALACSMLTGGILGYPVLEEQNRDLLMAWLTGDRTVKLSQLRTLGFYPSCITRYNARHMLRSLAEIIHMGGFSGLFIAIDDLEALISRSSLLPVHYTKMKREDTYESIRFPFFQRLSAPANKTNILYINRQGKPRFARPCYCFHNSPVLMGRPLLQAFLLPQVKIVLHCFSSSIYGISIGCCSEKKSQNIT